MSNLKMVQLIYYFVDEDYFFTPRLMVWVTVVLGWVATFFLETNNPVLALRPTLTVTGFFVFLIIIIEFKIVSILTYSNIG